MMLLGLALGRRRQRERENKGGELPRFIVLVLRRIMVVPLPPNPPKVSSGPLWGLCLPFFFEWQAVAPFGVCAIFTCPRVSTLHMRICHILRDMYHIPRVAVRSAWIGLPA